MAMSLKIRRTSRSLSKVGVLALRWAAKAGAEAAGWTGAGADPLAAPTGNTVECATDAVSRGGCDAIGVGFGGVDVSVGAAATGVETGANS